MVEYQRPEHHVRWAAKRIGVTPDEYMRQTQGGMAWCSGAKHWLPTADFRHSDYGRRNGYCYTCDKARSRVKKEA